MKIPVLRGMIKRRMLINFRVDPGVMQKLLPSRFRPKLHNGFAIAGICLIRLEHIRPAGFPALIGISSENAAHRVAVEWNSAGEQSEGVYISRRDSSSLLNHIMGGRIVSGEHHRATFQVTDHEDKINFAMQSNDKSPSISVRGFASDILPPSSCFASVDASSKFFETGSLGYSVSSDPHRLDGLKLKTLNWQVRALNILEVESSYFADRSLFPEGSVEFDHALIMRDIDHEWHQAAEMRVDLKPT